MTRLSLSNLVNDLNDNSQIMRAGFWRKGNKGFLNFSSKMMTAMSCYVNSCRLLPKEGGWVLRKHLGIWASECAC
jgi:hypothetical protein